MLAQDKRVDLAQRNNELLCIACGMTLLEQAKILLDDPHVDPSVDNNAILIVAIKMGDIELVKRLLKDPRIDPEVRKSKALRVAVERSQVEIVKLLLQDERVKTSHCNERFILRFVNALQPDEYVEAIEMLIFVLQLDVNVVKEVVNTEIHDGIHDRLLFVQCLHDVEDRRIAFQWCLLTVGDGWPDACGFHVHSVGL
jgi:hypothetical protein